MTAYLLTVAVVIALQLLRRAGARDEEPDAGARSVCPTPSGFSTSETRRSYLRDSFQKEKPGASRCKWVSERKQPRCCASRPYRIVQTCCRRR